MSILQTIPSGENGMSLSDEIVAMTDFCVHLRSIWRHYEILFETGDPRRRLLHQIAPTFFGDLNRILIEQLVLQICRLTDPATTAGRANLTIDYIVQKAGEASAAADQNPVIALHGSIRQFRSKIIPARNRLIAHLDREAVVADVPLGAASREDWHRFWRDLEELLRVVRARYLDPSDTFRLSEVGLISDADSLVQALRESTYFKLALGNPALTRQLDDVASNSEYFDA